MSLIAAAALAPAAVVPLPAYAAAPSPRKVRRIIKLRRFISLLESGRVDQCIDGVGWCRGELTDAERKSLAWIFDPDDGQSKRSGCN